MNTRNCVHRLLAADAVSAETIGALLAELENMTLASDTTLGRAVSFVVSNWRREPDGSFVAQFSPLLAERLPAPLEGIELLQAARELALSPLSRHGADAA